MNDPYFDAPVTGDKLLTVATYDDAVSARLALNQLHQAGLAAVLSDESTVAMDWLLSNAIGGIKVQVNPKDVTIARRLIEEHERQRAAADGAPAPLADEIEEESVGVETPAAGADEVPGAEDEPDLEEEPPLTTRERDGLRAFRGAMLGILFPPIELYVLYLVIKVFVSQEQLGARYRNMACAGAIIMLIVLGGCYALVRPG
jgi:hypothetical protein